MSELKRTTQFRAHSALVLAGVLLMTGAAAPRLAAGQARAVPDAFEATTTGMTPDGLTLKLDVSSWSDDSARADVVAALAEEDAAAALAELPSAGVVWRSGSAVGHSIKYAHRETDAQGREHVVVVTDKALDAYSFKPWEVPGRTGAEPLGYSVVELVLDEAGAGSGTLSLAADVEIDADAGLVSLADGGTVVLTGARELPKPYWAQADGG